MKTLLSLTGSPFPPDFFVGEFIYGWGNNYAGANVSNFGNSAIDGELRR